MPSIAFGQSKYKKSQVMSNLFCPAARRTGAPSGLDSSAENQLAALCAANEMVANLQKVRYWWAAEDSNLGPFGCKPNALGQLS